MLRSVLPFLLGLSTLGAVTGTLGENLLPGIIGQDDRVVLEHSGPPFDAVGQVNVGGFRALGRCTGTLIASDLVITAAHCIMDPWKKVPFPLKDVHFLASARNGDHKGHATAKCLRFPENYEFVPPDKINPSRPAQNVPIRAFFSDAVVIVLAEKVAVEPVKVALLSGEAASKVNLSHVAYPADRRHVPSIHRNCQLLQADPEHQLWFTDCDTHPASSGGPVFAGEAGSSSLVAIMLGSGQGSANIALPASVWGKLAEAAGCP